MYIELIKDLTRRILSDFSTKNVSVFSFMSETSIYENSNMYGYPILLFLMSLISQFENQRAALIYFHIRIVFFQKIYFEVLSNATLIKAILWERKKWMRFSFLIISIFQRTFLMAFRQKINSAYSFLLNKKGKQLVFFLFYCQAMGSKINILSYNAIFYFS